MSRSVEGTFDPTEGTYFCEHEKEYMVRSNLIRTVAYVLIELGSHSMPYATASEVMPLQAFQERPEMPNVLPHGVFGYEKFPSSLEANGMYQQGSLNGDPLTCISVLFFVLILISLGCKCYRFFDFIRLRFFARRR